MTLHDVQTFEKLLLYIGGDFLFLAGLLPLLKLVLTPFREILVLTPFWELLVLTPCWELLLVLPPFWELLVLTPRFEPLIFIGLGLEGFFLF